MSRLSSIRTGQSTETEMGVDQDHRDGGLASRSKKVVRRSFGKKTFRGTQAPSDRFGHMALFIESCDVLVQYDATNQVRVFRLRVRQVEPLLQEVNPQHLLQSQRLATLAGFG